MIIILECFVPIGVPSGKWNFLNVVNPHFPDGTPDRAIGSVMDGIRNKYGAVSLTEAGTAIKRSSLVGGHKEGVSHEFVPFDRLYIQAEDESATISELEQYKSYYPALQINTYATASKEDKEMFLQRWSIFIVVLLALVLAVMIGVCNTLINTIYSKRKNLQCYERLESGHGGL